VQQQDASRAAAGPGQQQILPDPMSSSRPPSAPVAQQHNVAGACVHQGAHQPLAPGVDKVQLPLLPRLPCWEFMGPGRACQGRRQRAGARFGQRVVGGRCMRQQKRGAWKPLEHAGCCNLQACKQSVSASAGECRQAGLPAMLACCCRWHFLLCRRRCHGAAAVPCCCCCRLCEPLADPPIL